MLVFAAMFLCFFLVLSAFSSVFAAEDPYELLGVSRDATIEEINRAHRKKVLELHPDNKLTGNAEAFSKVREAYVQLKSRNFDQPVVRLSDLVSRASDMPPNALSNALNGVARSREAINEIRQDRRLRNHEKIFRKLIEAITSYEAARSLFGLEAAVMMEERLDLSFGLPWSASSSKTKRKVATAFELFNEEGHKKIEQLIIESLWKISETGGSLEQLEDAVKTEQILFLNTFNELLELYWFSRYPKSWKEVGELFDRAFKFIHWGYIRKVAELDGLTHLSIEDGRKVAFSEYLAHFAADILLNVPMSEADLISFNGQLPSSLSSSETRLALALHVQGEKRYSSAAEYLDFHKWWWGRSRIKEISPSFAELRSAAIADLRQFLALNPSKVELRKWRKTMDVGVFHYWFLRLTSPFRRKPRPKGLPIKTVIGPRDCQKIIAGGA